MSEERKYYCLCESNCKFETMTKEQILAAIEQAVSTGSIQNVDTGFVTKVKEQNAGGYITFWIGTTAQYNALSSPDKNCLYIFTDDTTATDMEEAIAKIMAACERADQRATEAAAAAATAATNAETAVEKVTEAAGVDVTENIGFRENGSGVSTITTVFDPSKTKAVYSQALGIVFYKLNVLAMGTASDGDDICELWHDCFAIDGLMGTAACTHPHIRVTQYANQLLLNAHGDFNEADWVDTFIYGWYFCNATKYDLVKNMIPRSVNVDGSEYEGSYGENGYNNNATLSANGTEIASDGYMVTGFIPVNGGDVISFDGINVIHGLASHTAELCFYSADRATLIARENTDNSGNFFTEVLTIAGNPSEYSLRIGSVKVKDDFAGGYFRMTWRTEMRTTKPLTITINEPLW